MASKIDVDQRSVNLGRKITVLSRTGWVFGVAWSSMDYRRTMQGRRLRADDSRGLGVESIALSLLLMSRATIVFLRMRYNRV